MSIAHLFKYLLAAFGTIGFAKAPALTLRKRQLNTFLRGEKKYRFPSFANPRMSFIISVFNGAYHTLECLMSILRVADGSYEVIIVDDGCSDETTALLSYFENVRVRRNPQNVGFLRSVNAGAKLAIGQYLVLINNDARLVEGSLVAALDVYEAENNCGLMGARVRHVSGGLQEAGCMIYQDGTTNGYLRYQPEGDLRAMFQRDVDYCSGVFAIIARRHFESLGGLDEAYAPAYFEETDFCMRLRENGLRCIYYPRILVDHFEFGSSANSGAARQMIEDRRSLFLKRWAGTLHKQNFFPLEKSQITERAALRLLPHPRELLIFDANLDFPKDGQIADKNVGHITVYLLNGNAKIMKRLVAKAGVRVALAFGDWKQLRRFIKERAGIYDMLEVLTDMKPKQIAKLRSDMQLRS